MQRTWHFPGIPERFMIVVGGFHFNDSGTMPWGASVSTSAFS